MQRTAPRRTGRPRDEGSAATTPRTRASGVTRAPVAFLGCLWDESQKAHPLLDDTPDPAHGPDVPCVPPALQPALEALEPVEFSLAVVVDGGEAARLQARLDGAPRCAPVGISQLACDLVIARASERGSTARTLRYAAT